MDQSRYRDKAYLVTYELTTDIFELYNIKVDDIMPVRSVFILYTDRGVKILKKVNYGVDELEFIDSVLTYVTSNGFRNVVPFMRTAEGAYFVRRQDGIYVMFDLIEGREADYQNPIDISSVSKALYSFHESTHGIKDVIEKKNNLYKWIPSFARRAADLLKFKEIAEMHEMKTSFDELFLKNVDKHYEQALRSIKLLEDSSYNILCDETAKVKNICHHDLAYHNIIISNEGDVYFLDLDFCMMDLRIHDISNFIVKSIKYYNWDFGRAQNIIESYSAVSKLTAEELEVIYGFLTFPQDFYEVSRQYYMKTKNWDEEDFFLRLQRKSGYYDDRKVFLEEFKSEILN